MPASVLLMVCVLALYVVAMVMCWHGLSGQQPAARLETEGPLALKEGQTIVSVVETAQGLTFGIGGYGREEKSSDAERTR
jgi:hypothetical protein